MPTENDIIEGLDIVPLGSVSQQNLHDFLVKATASNNKGFVIFQSSAPDVVSNPRYSRYLWFDTVNVQLKYYDSIGLIWAAIPNATVSTETQIDDGVIRLIKLDPTEGNPGDIIHKDETTGEIQWASLASLLQVGTIGLNLLNTDTASEGSIIQFIGGIVVWQSQQTLADSVLSQLTSIDPNLLTGATPKSVLISDSSNNIGFTGANTFFGLVDAGVIPVSKLSIAGSADGYFLKISAGQPVWQATTFPFTKPVYIKDDDASYDGAVSLPRAVSLPTETILPFEHGLGGTPRVHRVVIVCRTAHGTYAVGDEIPIDQLRLYNTEDSVYSLRGSPFHYKVNATQFKIYMDATVTPDAAQTTAVYIGPDQTTLIVPNNWRFRIYAAL